jgi:hypothetical protein
MRRTTPGHCWARAPGLAAFHVERVVHGPLILDCTTRGLLSAMLQRPTEPNGGLTPLPLSALQPSPRNPRRRLDGVAELAESIREYGLLQPIVVRSVDEGYQVVAGHRRLEAVRALGWDTVPAVVQAVDEAHA